MKKLTKKHLEAVRSLIDKYRSLDAESINNTKEELENRYRNFEYIEIYYHDVLTKITGFGTSDCILCKSVKRDCVKCIYTQHIDTSNFDYIYDDSIMDCIYHYSETFEEIWKSITLEGFLLALRNRADLLEKLLYKYKEDVSNG